MSKNNISKLTAFDYGTQTWVTSHAAQAILITQARETISILEGSSGDEYARAAKYANAAEALPQMRRWLDSLSCCAQ